MSIRELFKELHDKDTNSLVKSLYATPKKEKGFDMPVTQVFKPNTYHQADLLFMPNDNGFRYILMVADAHNKKIDAEPIHNKEAKTVRNAFKKIYAREPLDLPHIIQTDAGHEFKGDVKEYFKDNKVDLKYGKPGRHRQQSIVERANQKVASLLFKRMTSQELKTNETSREWVDDLPEAIEVINEHLPTPLLKPKFNYPLVTKYNKELIPIGTKVRVQLDNPMDVGTDKRLAGKFRSTDVKWDKKERIVKQISIRPGFPPMYLLDGKGKNGLELVAYTKNQLQIIPDIEELPTDDIIRKPTKKEIPEERAEIVEHVRNTGPSLRYGLRERVKKISFV